MDSITGPRGLSELNRFLKRLNRSYVLGRIDKQDYEELHKATLAIKRKLQTMQQKEERNAVH